MSRQEVASAVAKVFAYLGCGKPDMARQYARQLIAWLETI